MTEHSSTELCGACRRIPISHLSLDVDEPVGGWMAYFDAKNITVMDDSLGRPSVARHVLADLIHERKEREHRVLEEAARLADEATPEAPIPAGVPALSDDASPFESLMAGDRSYVSLQDEFGRPRPNFLVEELEAGQRRQLAEQEVARRRKEKTNDFEPSRAGNRHSHRALRQMWFLVREHSLQRRRPLSVPALPRVEREQPRG